MKLLGSITIGHWSSSSLSFYYSVHNCLSTYMTYEIIVFSRCSPNTHISSDIYGIIVIPVWWQSWTNCKILFNFVSYSWFYSIEWWFNKSQLLNILRKSIPDIFVQANRWRKGVNKHSMSSVPVCKGQ